MSVEHNLAWCEKLKNVLRKAQWRKIFSITGQLPYNYNSCSLVDNGNANEGAYFNFKHITGPCRTKSMKLLIKLMSKSEVFLITHVRARIYFTVKFLSHITVDTTVLVQDAHRCKDKQFEYSLMLQYYDMAMALQDYKLRGIALIRRKRKLHHLKVNHSAVQDIRNDKYEL